MTTDLNKILSFYCLVLKSMTIDVDKQDNSLQITVINTSIISGLQGPQIVMTIPVELINRGNSNGSVRIVSAIYRNVSAFLSYDK